MVLMVLKDIGVYWMTILIIVAPFLLSPFLFVWTDSSEANCAYAILLIAVYWVADVLPLPVTALLPIVLFPLLGVLPAKKVASFYMADATFVMLAGLMMAVAIEKSNLHKRFGIWMLLFFGFTPSRMLLGFIIPSWFMSMFISNTATASLMVPIANNVMQQYRKGVSETRRHKNDSQGHENCACDAISDDNSSIEDKKTDLSSDFKASIDLSDEGSVNQSKHTIEEGSLEVVDDETEKKLTNLTKMLFISIAYAAGLGGNGTLTGASSNLIVAEEASKSFERHGYTSPLNYTTWFFLGFPFSLCGVLILAVWLKLYFLGWRSFRISCQKDSVDELLKKQENAVKNLVKEEYKKLGPISFGEISCLVFLLLMVLLWFARDPGFAPGYASLFPQGYVSDSVPAMLISVVLFIFPCLPPEWLCFRKDETKKAEKVEPLLNWRYVSTKLPWGTVILLGGGFAMAEACKASGLSVKMGELLQSLHHVPAWVLVLVTMLLISLVTEILCGCATLALFLPILDALSIDFCVNPLVLMLPAGLAASCAFMLPTGSIQNSIVFSYGHLKVIDSLCAGVAMNVLCLLLVGLAISTWGWAIFDLDTIPWTNATTMAF